MTLKHLILNIVLVNGQQAVFDLETHSVEHAVHGVTVKTLHGAPESVERVDVFFPYTAILFVERVPEPANTFSEIVQPDGDWVAVGGEG